jgi:sulfide dehydrogenase cytochrome subunit
VAAFGLPSQATAGGEEAFDRTAALAARCAACHGPGGGRAAIPPIAGLPAREIADKLRLFRDAGPKRDVMTTRASRLSDADIDALASYFARRTPDRPD